MSRPPRRTLLALACCVLAGCGSEGRSEWVRANSKTTQTLEALHGSGPQDIWAVGQVGTLVHWDGTSWSSVDAGTRLDLYAVWAVGPRDAWAVGSEGLVLHWNGTRWSRVELGVEKDTFTRVWASGPNDVWISPVRVRGQSAAGLLHFDGTTWRSRFLPNQDKPALLAGTGPADVWVTPANKDGVMQWNGTGWTSVPPELVSQLRWKDLWVGSGQRWVLGGDHAGTFLLQGGMSGWTRRSLEDAHLSSTLGWTGVWGSGEQAWVVGGWGQIVHFDGKAWTQELREDMSAPDLNDIWGTSEADLWAVGHEGVIVRRTPPSSP